VISRLLVSLEAAVCLGYVIAECVLNVEREVGNQAGVFKCDQCLALANLTWYLLEE
jgi:hypothetical protein